MSIVYRWHCQPTPFFFYLRFFSWWFSSYATNSLALSLSYLQSVLCCYHMDLFSWWFSFYATNLLSTHRKSVTTRAPSYLSKHRSSCPSRSLALSLSYLQSVLCCYHMASFHSVSLRSKSLSSSEKNDVTTWHRIPPNHCPFQWWIGQRSKYSIN